jgi:hypothetical protein
MIPPHRGEPMGRLWQIGASSVYLTRRLRAQWRKAARELFRLER